MPCTPPCPHCGPLYAAALEAVSHLTTDGVPEVDRG
jgi:hypothetical protein